MGTGTEPLRPAVPATSCQYCRQGAGPKAAPQAWSTYHTTSTTHTTSRHGLVLSLTNHCTTTASHPLPLAPRTSTPPSAWPWCAWCGSRSRWHHAPCAAGQQVGAVWWPRAQHCSTAAHQRPVACRNECQHVWCMLAWCRASPRCQQTASERPWAASAVQSPNDLFVRSGPCHLHITVQQCEIWREGQDWQLADMPGARGNAPGVLIHSPQPPQPPHPPGSAVSDATLARWRGFVGMIVTGYFEQRMAWFPLERLTLELSAVQVGARNVVSTR